WTTPSVLEVAEGHLYAALSHAASCAGVSADQDRPHIEALHVHHHRLLEWAEHCPDNFQNRALLIGAEIARVEGRALDAKRLYEAAIESARENEFVQNEALASELAARFHAARGFARIARAYRRDARDAYRQWGASGKVQQLEAQYPYLSLESSGSDLTQTVTT